ncbi:MAG: hypothetical protein IJ752_09125 [Alphaproteobacteria bacterium]|nr:hypothetical protein [Alphaproteobacteria bacterium]
MTADFKEPLQPGAVRFPLSSNTPKKLAIYLHGMGGTGETNAWFAEALREVMPETVFYIPDAYEPMFGNEEARQWFAIPEGFKDEWLAIPPSKMSSGLRQRFMRMYENYNPAALKVAEYIRERMTYHGISAQNTYLFGVSQGAMLALQLAAESDLLADRAADGTLLPLGGVMTIAGCLLNAQAVEEHPSQSKPEFVMIHGSLDITVPYRAFVLADKTMFAHGQKTETKVVWGRDHTFFEKEALPTILRLASRWGK